MRHDRQLSEKVNRDIAVQTGRYSVGGLAIVSASLDNEGRTVTLRTSSQQDKTVYSLTVSGIPDLAGNVMDTKSGLLFGGISNPILPVKLQSIAGLRKHHRDNVRQRYQGRGRRFLSCNDSQGQRHQRLDVRLEQIRHP